jgi:hypothetical protein
LTTCTNCRCSNSSGQLVANISQVLPSLCLVPAHPRCADQTECVLRAVSIPVLGRHQRCQSILFPEPDFADCAGPGSHRNGIPVGLVDVRAVVYHTGTVAPADLAVPQGESSRCDIPSEWDALACSDAKRIPYPDVEP